MESIFCLLLVVEASFLKKVVEMLARSGSWLLRTQVKMMDEAKLCVQFVQRLTCWLCDVQSDIVLEKNWALSVDQCQLQALQFLEHVIDLLSILLSCNGFARIRKLWWIRWASHHQTATMTFYGARLALESALELLLGPTTELVIAGC